MTKISAFSGLFIFPRIVQKNVEEINLNTELLLVIRNNMDNHYIITKC